MASLKLPDNGDRKPIDLCCVIDTSGSMGGCVEMGGSDGGGFSVLDIVKHAMRTIIHSLNEKDRLSIVSFSDNASIVVPQNVMDLRGREFALAKVDLLQPELMTNLWAGLETGMKILAPDPISTSPIRNKAIFLLTDGLPNRNPPRGILSMVQRYKEKHGSHHGVLHTFGFGTRTSIHTSKIDTSINSYQSYLLSFICSP
jgi:Mg-chelatase subunit ChlD